MRTTYSLLASPTSQTLRQSLHCPCAGARARARRPRPQPGDSAPGWSPARKEGRGSQTGPPQASPETQTEALAGTGDAAGAVCRHPSQAQTGWEGEEGGRPPPGRGAQGQEGCEPDPSTPGFCLRRPQDAPVSPLGRSQRGACPSPPVRPASPLRPPRGASAPRLNSDSPSSRAAVRRD